jgi:hypothetical protein
LSDSGFSAGNFARHLAVLDDAWDAGWMGDNNAVASQVRETGAAIIASVRGLADLPPDDPDLAVFAECLPLAPARQRQ